MSDPNKCRICGLSFVPSEPSNVSLHAEIHRGLARGDIPQPIRDFMKAFGWAVAHNDGGLERLKGRYDSETGKLTVIFAWWNRARSNGAPERDFDDFMAAHLRYADALVANDESEIHSAQTGIGAWERFAG